MKKRNLVIKTFLWMYIGFLCLLSVFELSPRALSYQRNNPWINTSNKPWIIPHGGAKAMYPENTIFAFEQTAKYDVFEIDLALTKDDILISHHDLDLRFDLLENELRDELIIRNLTYAQIISTIQDNDYPYVRSFVDVNGLMPYAFESNPLVLNKLLPQTLESLFMNYPEKRFILELKDTKTNNEDTFMLAAQKLFELIETYQMKDSVIVSSFSDEVIEKFRTISNHQIHTSTATNETLKVVILSAFSLDFFYKPTYAAMIMPIKSSISNSQYDLIKRLPKRISARIVVKNESGIYTNLVQASLIEDLRRHQMSSIYWTVNEIEDMRTLIKLGVDGIITDRPDLLEALYKASDN
ncbi:MAG: glycerophosphodiester phosphodiesterase family protein [Acholeplasma sp.]|nr:glycerophosphodiester phosphodiesterase family protein [Acholeplasma sp.]